MFPLFSTLSAVLLSLIPLSSGQQNLTDAQVAILVQRLADVTSKSWEYATQQQALMELQTPSFSVLNDTKLPPSHTPPESLNPVIDIIRQIVQNRAYKLTGSGGLLPLFPDEGSSADSAANGVAVLIADWTGKSTSELDFGQAAQDQLDFLFSSQVPKTEDGAISHRKEDVQLWNDFCYMIPPFLAYYGVLKNNQTLVWQAYNQLSLYRKYLQDWSAGGLWKHIQFGSWVDNGYWATGVGWAAAGMLRVLGTIRNSNYARSMTTELTDLTNWVTEIHDAMYRHMRDDGLFYNYVTDQSTFADAASASLLAATVYRHALLTGTYKHLPDAEFVRRKLWAPTPGEGNDFADPNSFRDMAHFTPDGFVTPVVNPNNFVVEGEKSPEAQAFAIQLYAAWKDWVAHGSPGAGGSVKLAVVNVDFNRRSQELEGHRNRMKRVRRSIHT